MRSYSDLVREVKRRIQEDVRVVFDKAKMMSEIQREIRQLILIRPAVRLHMTWIWNL